MKGMHDVKPSIFFIGNCHAGVLRNAIGRLGAVTDNYDLVYVRNDMHASVWHPDIVDALRRCTLCFEQVRSDHEEIRESVHQRLPPDCGIVRFAPSFLNSLWPFAAEDPRNRRYPFLPEGAYPKFLSNRFVLEFLRRGDTADDAAKRFLDMDIKDLVDLDRLHEISLAQLEELELGADLRLATFIGENFSTKRLFLMPLHPAGPVIAELARQVIDILGVASNGAVSELLSDISAFRGVGAYDAPVHPQVSAHFKLGWADKLSYRHFDEGDFSHDEYVFRHARLDFDLRYYEALRLMDMGRPRDAYALLERAVADNPQSRYYRRTFGALANQLGRSADAVAVLRSGTADWPDDGALWLELARAAAAEDHQGLADNASAQAVSKLPGCAEAWRVRSWVLGQAGRITEADMASREYHWFRGAAAIRPLTERSGAEFGRHWLGFGASGF